jgi:hypothetical protein
MSSKAIKGKQPLQQTIAMTRANPKFVMGQLMLTADELDKAGQPCIDLHNNYIQNYKSGLDILVSYMDHHFLVGDDVFIITFFNLYNLFNLDMLDISNALHRIVSPQKLASSIYSIYVLYVFNKFGILRIGTCNNKLLIKRERNLLHNC